MTASAVSSHRATPTSALLVADDLHFAYAHEEVLCGVGLHADPGQIVAVVGPNGCGKSTLLRVLLGQLRARGTVLWSGRPVRSWRARDLARRVAYLPQQPVAPPGMTVAQTIALGRYPHLGPLGLESGRDIEVVLAAADTLGLRDWLDRPVDTLSGGQRQRVFFARALAQEPQALLLDEPDTFLDLHHTTHLAAILRQLARGDERRPARCIVMATHNLHLAAAVAGDVVLLDRGRVVAAGPPADVLTPERISRVYGVRAVRWTTAEGWGVGVLY